MFYIARLLFQQWMTSNEIWCGYVCANWCVNYFDFVKFLSAINDYRGTRFQSECFLVFPHCSLSSILVYNFCPGLSGEEFSICSREFAPWIFPHISPAVLFRDSSSSTRPSLERSSQWASHYLRETTATFLMRIGKSLVLLMKIILLNNLKSYLHVKINCWYNKLNKRSIFHLNNKNLTRGFTVGCMSKTMR